MDRLDRLAPPAARGGFGPATTIGLALLGVPRVVLHDLGVVDEGHPFNLVLVFGPPVVWALVALARRISHPVRALAWVGAAYGVLLAAAHQVLWRRAFDGDPPRLGGNLEGELPEAVEEAVLRAFAAASGVLTGLAVGVVCGLVTRWLMGRHR